VIHWHGFALAGGDGWHRVGAAARATGESFEYRFLLPDAGTFWYHSHANETVQIERGLYGALIVLGDDEPALDADRVLVLDDLKLDRKGRIAKTATLRSSHRPRRAGAADQRSRRRPCSRSQRGTPSGGES